MIQKLHQDGLTLWRRRNIKPFSSILLTSLRYIFFRLGVYGLLAILINILRLTPASLNMMLWFVLLFDRHLATRLLVRYSFYVLAMALCGKMVLAICKKEKGFFITLIGKVRYLHFIIDSAISTMSFYPQ